MKDSFTKVCIDCMETTRKMQCLGLFLPLCVRDKRREQLTESNGIKNGMESATWQEL